MAVTSIDEHKRVCGHCKEPIIQGQLVWTVPTPGGDFEVHETCMHKGTERDTDEKKDR